MDSIKIIAEIPPEIEHQSQNFRNVQIDAVGVGLANAASPFLPVFLTHLNSSSFQIGMLTAMPAVTGLILAIPLGRFLQRQSNVVKWFSIARLVVIACYALTGIISFLIPPKILVNSILVVWAFATIPQTVVAIAFSVVMNAVAGPNRRFELMTRRWTTLGITTTLTVIGIGQLLDRVIFPLNYQLMFIGLSLGGLISYYFSSHIKIKTSQPLMVSSGKSIKLQVKEYKDLVFNEKPFISFIVKRLIFMTGTSLAAPLVPLYLVRVVHATDGWISVITTFQTAVLVLGYFFWTRQSRKTGSQSVLLWSTLGVSLYPLLMALTHSTWQITVFAGLSGIFQAGVDLVFFDELMRRVPINYSAIFVSFAQSIQYLSAIISPLIGTTIADHFGIGVGLMVSAAIRLIGFALFFFAYKKSIKTLPQPV